MQPKLFESEWEILTDKQKKDKVKNLLQALRLEDKIVLEYKFWKLKKV